MNDPAQKMTQPIRLMPKTICVSGKNIEPNGDFGNRFADLLWICFVLVWYVASQFYPTVNMLTVSVSVSVWAILLSKDHLLK